MSGYWIFLPFVFQAILIFADEKIFHLKRDLPKWERWGHPLDTLTVLCCLIFVQAVDYSPHQLKYYIALAVFSTLFITKDEWVHKDCCPKTEMWLHAVLFINHPILLTCLGFMWSSIHVPSEYFAPPSSLFIPFLRIQTLLVGAFMLYQILYWNFVYVEKRKSHQ